MTLLSGLGILVALLYGIAFVFSLVRIIVGNKIAGAIGLRLAVVAAMVQGGVLALHFYTLPTQTLRSFQEEFQLAAWVIALTYIFLCFVKKFYAASPFFLPIILVFSIISLVRPDAQLATVFEHRGSGYLAIHLMVIFLTLAAFSVGLVTSLLFLLEESRIKSKNLNAYTLKLPPLAVIDDIHYKALFAGFVFFSLTIITGAGYAKITTGHYLTGDIKQFLSLLCWFFFAALLNFRVRKGWQGHKGITLSLIGFAGMGILFIVGLA